MDAHKLITAFKESETIEEALIRSGGEITPELEAYSKKIDLQVREQVDGVKYTMDKLALAVEYWKKRAKESQVIAKSLGDMAERIKNQVKQLMIESKNSDILGVDYRYKLSRKPSKIVVDGNLIPIEYCKQVTKFEPDMDLIAAHMEMGKEVPGCKYEEVHALNCYPNKT